MEADEEAVPQRRQRRWWMLVVGVVLVSFAATTVVLNKTDDPPLPNSCPSDALIGANGETYGRSREQYCCFVDDQGEVIKTDDICRRLRAG